MKKKRENRDKIIKKLPGVFTKMELEINVQDAIKYCKEWVMHRNWLISNKVKFDKFPEEEDFQK